MKKEIDLIGTRQTSIFDMMREPQGFKKSTDGTLLAAMALEGGEYEVRQKHLPSWRFLPNRC